MKTIIVFLEFTAAFTLCMSQTTQLPGTVRPLEPEGCPIQEQIAFTSTLPNASVCGPSLGFVLTRIMITGERFNNTPALIRDLDNVCIENCGGDFTDFLRSERCNDTLGALTLELACTLTNGTADVGPYCRLAFGDINQTIFTALVACDNSTTCESGCREALIQLKSQIGCCYQNLYNNTEYLMQLLEVGLFNQFVVDRLMELSNPEGNPWDLCGVTSPMKCTGEPFGKFNV